MTRLYLNRKSRTDNEIDRYIDWKPRLLFFCVFFFLHSKNLKNIFLQKITDSKGKKPINSIAPISSVGFYVGISVQNKNKVLHLRSITILFQYSSSLSWVYYLQQQQQNIRTMFRHCREQCWDYLDKMYLKDNLDNEKLPFIFI